MMANASHIATSLRSVAEYGDQLGAVFHKHALTAKKIPRGFEGAINILDATVAVLKPVLDLVNQEADGKKFFSIEGLAYVELLVQECANTLAKVEPTMSEAGLEREERKARRKQSKKAAKKLTTAVDPRSLMLDEKDFLNKVENAQWHWAGEGPMKVMERLYDLQLHLLLISEVVSVGALSKDL